MSDAEQPSTPSIQEIAARYERARAEAQRAVDDRLGPRSWERSSELHRALCPGNEEPRLVEWGLPRLTAAGGIADADWLDAVHAVRTVLERYGFAPPETVVDRPGDHEVQFRDGYGAVLLFGAYVNTILSVRTGCHPDAAEEVGS